MLRSLSFLLQRLHSLLDELLDLILLLLILLLRALNFLEKFNFGLLSLLLDEVELLLVEGVMVLDRSLEVGFDLLQLFWDALDSRSLSVFHDKDVVVPSLEIITIDLNVLLVHDLSETIDILKLFLDNILVTITDDSNKEIQEYDQENDDVENVEDRPDDSDHDLRENGIVVEAVHPVSILRCRNIPDSVPGGLHDVDNNV